MERKGDSAANRTAIIVAIIGALATISAAIIAASFRYDNNILAAQISELATEHAAQVIEYERVINEHVNTIERLNEQIAEKDDEIPPEEPPPPGEILLFATHYVDVRDVRGFRIVQGSTGRHNGIQLSYTGIYDANYVTYALNGNALTFTATLNAARNASIFRVYGDERLLYESPPLASTAPPIPIEIDVSDVFHLRLEVEFMQSQVTDGIFENATILTTG